MLVVIDTNIFISSLLKGKTTGAILEAFLNKSFELVVSEDLLLELDTTARKTRLSEFISPTDISNLLKLLIKKAKLVKPTRFIQVCRDPADNKILECALASNAQIIVSRDKNLLSLSPFHTIDILIPAEFLVRLKKRRI